MSGLVDYDYSDSDSENESQEEKIVEKDIGTEEESSSSTNVLKNLPKIQHAQPKITSTSTLLSKDFVKRTVNGRIQIKAPVLNVSNDDYDSDDEDTDERERKRLKPSNKGSDLFSILPEPKQKVIKSITNANDNKNGTKILPSSGLVPKSVSDRTKVLKASVFKPNIANTESSDDDDDETESFFFTKHEPIVQVHGLSFTDASSEHDQIEYSPARPQIIEDNPGPSNSHDDFAYKRMIASKFGEEAPENINIVDFNMDDHLKNNKEWIKNISKESEAIEDNQIGGPAPTSAAKRRNQITYLAYQAKKREVELKNQWAANRQTMQQSRSRYGF